MEALEPHIESLDLELELHSFKPETPREDLGLPLGQKSGELSLSFRFIESWNKQKDSKLEKMIVPKPDFTFSYPPQIEDHLSYYSQCMQRDTEDPIKLLGHEEELALWEKSKASYAVAVKEHERVRDQCRSAELRVTTSKRAFVYKKLRETVK